MNHAIGPEFHPDINMASAQAAISMKFLAEQTTLCRVYNGTLVKALHKVLGADTLEQAHAIADDALAEYDGKE